jgi:hypothetical protein
MSASYPFFYFYDLDFNPLKIMEYVNSLPEDEWIGPHIGNFDPTIKIEPHPADDKLWVATEMRTNFLKCAEIKDIADYFTKGMQLFSSIMIKKSIKGHETPFHPLMQNLEFDIRNNISRTFDIIVPLQGGFQKSSLEAIDTKTDEYFRLIPKGKAFMVPNDPSWHYRWCETVYDFRYTLHLRGIMPITYKGMKSLYYKNV